MKKVADIIIDAINSRNPQQDYWLLGEGKQIPARLSGIGSEGLTPGGYYRLTGPEKADIGFGRIATGQPDRFGRPIHGTATGTAQGRRAARQAANDAYELFTTPEFTTGEAVTAPINKAMRSAAKVFEDSSARVLPAGGINWNAGYKAQTLPTGTIDKNLFGKILVDNNENAAAALRAVYGRGNGMVVRRDPAASLEEFKRNMRRTGLTPKDVIMLGPDAGDIQSWYANPSKAGLLKKIKHMGTSARHSAARFSGLARRKGLSAALRRTASRNKPALAIAAALAAGGGGAAGWNAYKKYTAPPPPPPTTLGKIREQLLSYWRSLRG